MDGIIEPLLTRKQAAGILAVSVKHLEKMVKLGKLHAIDVSLPDSKKKRWRFKMGEIKKFIDNC
jgi:phage pi2 protein 07